LTGSPGSQVAQVGAPFGLVRHVGLPPVVALGDDGQTTPVDGDRVAQPGILDHRVGGDPHPLAALGVQPAKLLDDSGEHRFSAPGDR
jgi:hypothetical protein